MFFSRLLAGGHGPVTWVWQMKPSDSVRTDCPGLPTRQTADPGVVYCWTPLPSPGDLQLFTAPAGHHAHINPLHQHNAPAAASYARHCTPLLTALLRAVPAGLPLATQITSKAIPLAIMCFAATGVGYGGYNLIMKEPGN